MPKDFVASFAGFSHCGLCVKKHPPYHPVILQSYNPSPKKKPHRDRRGYILKKEILIRLCLL